MSLLMIIERFLAEPDAICVRNKIVRVVVWALTGLAVSVPMVIGLGRFALDMNAAAVLTGSMRPTYSPGDAVVTRPTPVAAIHPGMIVLATPPNQTTPFAHRVVAVAHRDGVTYVRTKGDANPVDDTWTDVFHGGDAPQVVGVVPKLGYLIAGLQRGASRPGLPFLTAGLLLTVLATTFVLVAAPSRLQPAAV
jgi:signal peptidase